METKNEIVLYSDVEEVEAEEIIRKEESKKIAMQITIDESYFTTLSDFNTNPLDIDNVVSQLQEDLSKEPESIESESPQTDRKLSDSKSEKFFVKIKKRFC